MAQWEANDEVQKVAEKFILANCYNPEVALSLLSGKCQVSESQNTDGLVEITLFTKRNNSV
ncbi:MAG: hypothetical protein WBB28_28135 [Crinalium sp.]